MSIARLSVALACPLVACGTALAQTQLLVSDAGGSKVVRYKYPSGLPFDDFVGPGISPLINAYGMTLGPDGLLYVCGYGDNNGNGQGVFRYSAVTGEFLGQFASVSRPTHCAFGPDGYLYVVNNYNGRVERRDPATGLLFDVFVDPGEGGLSNPEGLAFDKDGILFLASHGSNQVLKYDRVGGFIEAIDLSVVGLTGPVGVGFDGQGNLIVTGDSSNSIAKVTPDGKVSLLVSPNLGGLSNPWEFTFDDGGNLVVASEGGNGAVLKYSPNGEYLGTVVNSFSGGLSGDPLSVLFLPPPKDECNADFDGNGILDLFDFLAFVNAFNAGC